MWKRIFRRVGLGFLVFLGVLGIGSTVVLNTNFVKNLVNTWEDGQIDYSYAISPLPGIVYVSGFELRHQDRNVEWNTNLNHVFVVFNLFGLIKHSVDIRAVRAYGVDFRFGMRKTKGPARDLMPIFPGLNKPPKKPHKEEAFEDRAIQRISIAGVRLQGFKFIWFDKFKFSGHSEVGGSFEIIPDTRVTVGPAYWKTTDGSFTIADSPVLESFTFDSNVQLTPFDPNAPDIDDIKFLNMDVSMQAQLHSIEFLNFYLRKLRWFKANAGSGPVDVKIKMRNGVIEPPSQVKLGRAPIRLSVFTHPLEGTAEISGQVESEKGKDHGIVKIEFDDFAVSDPDTKFRHLQGKQLQLAVKSPSLSLRDLFSELSLQWTIVDAEVPSLAYYNRYLPKTVGLEITDGKGKFDMDIQGSSTPGKDTGTISLKVEKAGVRYEELQLTGDLIVDGKLKTGNLETRSFEITGTSVRLQNVSVGNDADDWWTKVQVNSGRFALGSPLTARVGLEMNLKNSRPIIALYSVKHPLPGIVDALLPTSGLQAAMQFNVGKDGVDIPHASVQGKGVEVLGRFRLLDWDRRSVVLAKVGMISVALGRGDGKTELVINEAENWYRQHLKFPPQFNYTARSFR